MSTIKSEPLTLSEIKKYDTKALIEFLQKEEDLRLDEEDLEIIRKQKINGCDFLDLTQEELERREMKLGPAKRLVKFASECKEKKLRAFSTYRSLKEVLAKYGISNGIKDIPQFLPGKVNFIFV